jgi:leucyl-tRNA synthetase
MYQYYLKITDYAQELLDDLDKLEGNWPSQVLTMQKNWIGRSVGLEFGFTLSDDSKAKLDNKFDGFEVFTTRADTIYGVSYSALAPEHEIVNYIVANKLIDDESIAKIKAMQKVGARDRATQDKEGLYLGIDVVHPLTGKVVPVWVANFVLTDYGSGAVMAVPAHDERDYEFAKKYDLEINSVIKSKDDTECEGAFTDAGIMINSDIFDGMDSTEAKEAIIKKFESESLGKKVINFKLKDWGLSRQRYWGAPIPTVHCDDCGVVAESKENLPIALPEDVEITGEGNPLDKHDGFRNCKCPKCGKDATRETDTMDTFIQSSWYFLRYTNPSSNMENEAFSKEHQEYWMGVDEYIGGIEHAIMHLLYSRFFTKVLRDLDYVKVDEPFKKLLTQGMVLKDGAKMSKSKGNVVDPDKIISEYGADTARLFILFAAPPTKELEWNDSAVEGSFRFLKRFFDRSENAKATDSLPSIEHASLSKEEKYARKKVYEALLKSQEVFKKTFAYNTLIASCMEAMNALNDQKNESVWTEGYWILSNILEPIVPHICWEISKSLFDNKNFGELSVIEETLSEDTITLAITVNGKKRAEIEVSKEASKDEVLAESKKIVEKWIEGKNIIKEIFVPNKLINIVVK